MPHKQGILVKLGSMARSPTFKEAVRFGVSRGPTTICDFGIMAFLVEIFRVAPFLASGVSFAVAVALDYFLCRYWVFKSEKPQSTKAFLLFIATSVVGLGLNLFLVWIFTYVFAIFYLAAKAASIIAVSVFNFIFKKIAMSL